MPLARGKLAIAPGGCNGVKENNTIFDKNNHMELFARFSYTYHAGDQHIKNGNEINDTE